MTVTVLAYWKATERFHIAAIKLSCRDSIAGEIRTKYLCKMLCNYYIAKGSLPYFFS